MEQIQAERAAQRAAKQAADRTAAAAAERKATRRAAKRKAADDAHQVEQARVAGLRTIRRSSRVLFDKRIGDQLRAQLLEHVDELEDGSTTTRWSVQSYWPPALLAPSAGDFVADDDSIDVSEPFTRLDTARARYQSWRYDPERTSVTTAPDRVAAARAADARPASDRSAATVAGLLGLSMPETDGRCHYCGAALTSSGDCPEC
ncbi:hypothetical protein [Nocardia brasiliensis]|uniref:hypothetical protein n=1 Tax=Nocardia brasiliensis TaxID=37326 RepID=UPI003D9345B6